MKHLKAGQKNSFAKIFVGIIKFVQWGLQKCSNSKLMKIRRNYFNEFLLLLSETLLITDTHFLI